MQGACQGLGLPAMHPQVHDFKRKMATSGADVAALARPVLTHRMALSFAARARGESLAGIIDRTASRKLGLEAAA